MTEARPGPAPFPGGGTPAPVWIGVFGAFDPGPAAGEPSAAFRILAGRSAAFGVLVDAMAVDAGGWWDVHEAWVSDAPVEAGGLLATFLVDLTVAGAPPISLLLGCVEEVIARLGVAAIDAVQVTVPGREPASPLPVRGPGSTGALARSGPPFGLAETGRPVAATLTVDRGGPPGPDVPGWAEALLGWLGAGLGLALGVGPPGPGRFRFPPPPITPALWHGPAVDGLVAEVHLPEQSVAGVAWLVACCWHAAHAAGLGAPVAVSIALDDPVVVDPRP